ncbi:MAG: hypothetical protein HC769_22745, partial [Cyanobacteria bacterium CRU_2_1]|nr:hypothetical protein [Cyanobacteria bacterium CRU_2_1]
MSKFFKPSLRWQLAIAFASGILMGLTPAPANAEFLAWIAIVPLWVLVSSNPQSSIFYAIAWGMGYHGLALSWITGLHPLTWLGVPWLASIGITLFAWIAVTLWGVILVTLWAGLFTFLCTRGAPKKSPSSHPPTLP